MTNDRAANDLHWSFVIGHWSFPPPWLNSTATSSTTRRPIAGSRPARKGSFRRSQDLASAALLLIGLLALLYWGSDLGLYFGRLFRESLGGEAWRELDRDDLPGFWLSSTWSLAVAVVPFLGVLMLAGIAVNLGQTGFVYLPQKVASTGATSIPSPMHSGCFPLPGWCGYRLGCSRLRSCWVSQPGAYGSSTRRS